jgi:transposase
MRRAYQTDLSDEEWEILEPHLPVPRAPGRPRLHPLREILDAVFYVVRGGCAWRLLPHDFQTTPKPPKSTALPSPGATTMRSIASCTATTTLPLFVEGRHEPHPYSPTLCGY